MGAALTSALLTAATAVLFVLEGLVCVIVWLPVFILLAGAA